jgi:leader peptidase (prepilin peptidase)/N-methyltransferase
MPIVALLFLGLLGGATVNYLADVLPVTRRIGWPVCWNCETRLSGMDYFLLRRCKTCDKLRSPRTYAIQILIPMLIMLLKFMPPHRLELPLALVLLLYLAVVAVIDIEHRLILHVVSLAGACLGLGIGIHLHGTLTTLMGGAAGYGIMLAFYFLGEVFARYVSKKRNEPLEEVALGFGDVNLAGITGLLLGWPGIIIGLLFTILAGGLVSLLIVIVMLIQRQYRAFLAIPYAPFLILSVLVLIFRP